MNIEVVILAMTLSVAFRTKESGLYISYKLPSFRIGYGGKEVTIGWGGSVQLSVFLGVNYYSYSILFSSIGGISCGI